MSQYYSDTYSYMTASKPNDKNDNDSLYDIDHQKIDPSLRLHEKNYSNFDVYDYLHQNQNPANENF